jgi:hypothetical protein
MVSSGFLYYVTLVRTDVSEEPGASFIRVTKIGELGTTQAATSNRRALRRNTKYLVFLRFLQESRGVTTQKTPFLILKLLVSTFSMLVVSDVTLSCLSFRILKSDELKDEVYEVDTDADQVDEVRRPL